MEELLCPSRVDLLVFLSVYLFSFSAALMLVVVFTGVGEVL